MGTFKEHIHQSKRNLTFLSEISVNVSECWDWQVTVCFYSALHLINAHVVEKTGANYLSHSKVDEIINPYNHLSVAKLDESVYTSYIKLFQLSRRSRYLIRENFQKGERQDLHTACSTYSKHLKKAIHHLNIIINFINKAYKESFSKTSIKCIDLNGLVLEHFTVLSLKQSHSFPIMSFYKTKNAPNKLYHDLQGAFFIDDILFRFPINRRLKAPTNIVVSNL